MNSMIAIPSLTQAIDRLCKTWKTELNILDEDDGNNIGNVCNKWKVVQRGIMLSADKIKNDNDKMNIQELSDSVRKITDFIEENYDLSFGKDKLLLEYKSMIDQLDFRYYAKNLLQNFQKTIKNDANDIIRDPVNVEILAKAVLNSKFNFPLETNLVKFYELIMCHKFRDFPKSGADKKNPYKGFYFDDVYQIHQNVAVKTFLPNRADLYGSIILSQRLKIVVSEVGLLKRGGSNQFKHFSFAEYLFSQWLVDNLSNEYVQKFWLQNVMTKDNFANVRKFLNGFVEFKRLKGKFSVETLRGSDYFGNPDDAKVSNLHLLAKEGLSALIELFFYYVNMFPVTISNNILKIDEDRRNVLHIACKKGSRKLVKLLLEFSENNMSRITMQQLLQQKDIDGLNPFQLAAKRDKVHSMRPFFDHYYRKCTNGTKTTLLLDQTMFGENPLLWAAMNNRLRAFSTLLCFSEEFLREERFGMLLFKPSDCCSGTILHAAASKSHADIVCEILICIERYLSKQDLKGFLFEKDDSGHTALHVVASADSMDAVNEIWKFAENNLAAGELQEFLMETDKYKSNESVLHTVAKNSDVRFAERFCDLSKTHLNKHQLRDFLTKTTTTEEETALHYSVKNYNVGVFNKMWYFAVRTLDAENLQNLLLKTSKDGCNVIHKAAYNNNIDVLNKLWNYAKNTLGIASMQLFLFGLNERRENIFSIAALKGNLDLLRKSWGFLNSHSSFDVIDKILTASNLFGKTVLHLSAVDGRVDVLKELLNYANSVLSMTSFRIFLMKLDEKDRTCLQFARLRGKREYVEYLADYATNVLSRESLFQFLDN